MKSSSIAIAATVALAAGATMHATDARAAISATTPVGACLGSSPASEANLRERPLGVRNEGATAVFVSCAAQWGYNPYQVIDASIVVTNANAQAVDVACTLVDGVLDTVAYFPKTVSIAANGTGKMVWRYSDYGNTSFSGFENFSCNLPPGVEINFVGFGYESHPFGN